MGRTSSHNYPAEYQYAGGYGYQTEPTTDDGLDLQYGYQRRYDPQTGRFITRGLIRRALHSWREARRETSLARARIACQTLA